MAEPVPPGLELPLCTALTQPVLLAGVPRNYAILIGTLAGMLTIGMHFWLFGTGLGLAAYAAGRVVTARDPWGFAVWARHLRQPGLLEA